MSRATGRIRWSAIRWLALAAVTAGMTVPALAQYPGRIKKDAADNTPPLRATGVFEWTGDLSKPKAGRLIPIAVWDGDQYQPGGLYLAQPAPLTVYSGTIYELQQAGAPKGLFQVNGAENLQGSWIAVGSVKPEFAPPKPKRTTAKLTPQVVKDTDSNPDRPTLHRKAGSDGDTGSSSGTTTSSAPSSDPDRPTLHRKDSSDTNGNTGSNGGSGGGSQTNGGGTPTASTDPDRPTLHRRDGGDSGSSGDSGNSSSQNAPTVDPDRPTLHHPASKASSNDSGAPVTATANTDPDRPKLRYGKPETPVGMVEPSKLEGLPADLNQMAAISDAKPSETHPYVYSWSDPADAAKAKSAMEDLAKKALAPKQEKPATTPSATKTVPRSTAARRKSAPQPAAPLPQLEDEKFGAFELAYNAGATLVLTAKSTGDDKTVKYVTLIAQPDFYGVPQVIFQQVTSDDRLEITRRMRLVDAVDTDADHRAELIFELRGKTDREFAIYRVANRKLEEAFNTGPLP